MNEIKLCEVVRAHYSHDREFCLYPDRMHDGIVQARAVAYNPTTTINLEFFEEKYGVQVWIAIDGEFVMYEPGNVQTACFMIRDFAYFLYKRSKEAYLVLLYSLFFHAKRLIKNATAAADAVEAAYAAADAAAHHAVDAAEAADAAAADAHVDAYKHIKNALKNLFKFRKELIKNE